MGIFAGLIALVCWGLALFLAAVASRKIGNVLTLFWMQLCGFVVAFIYFLFSGQQFPINELSLQLPNLILIAILQVVAYLSFYKGVEKGNVTLVAPLASSWSLITVLLSVVIYHETLKSTQGVAIGLLLFGILTLSLNIKSLINNKGFGLLVGVKEGIMAMLGWGVSLFLLIGSSKSLGWFFPAFIFRFLILCILTTIIVASKKDFLPKSQKFPWVILLLIGLFDVCAFFAYSIGVSSISGAIVAPISSAYTLVTIALGVMVFKEKINTQQGIGIALLISGLVLIAL